MDEAFVPPMFNETDLVFEPVKNAWELFQITNLVVAICIILVNTLVVLLFLCRRDLLQTPSHKLLLSLAFCDLSIGFTVMFHVIISVTKDVELIYRIIVDIFTSLLTQTVILHLCGITLDRFLSLFYALRYRDLVTITRSLQYIAFAWFLPTFASFIQMSWLYRIIDGEETEIDEEIVGEIEPWYSIIMLAVFFILPMIMLTIAFGKMFIEIRKLLLRTPSVRNGASTSLQTHRQRRIVTIFCIMYICFLVFSLPYFALRLIGDLQYWATINVNLENVYFDLAYTMKALTSLSNPIIYTAMNREFRSVIFTFYENLRRKLNHSRLRRLSVASSNFVAQSIRRRSHPSTSGGDSGIDDICAIEIQTEMSMIDPDETRL